MSKESKVKFQPDPILHLIGLQDRWEFSQPITECSEEKEKSSKITCDILLKIVPQLHHSKKKPTHLDHKNYQ